jgi:A/G-specific adenine glycosylase
MPKNTLKKLIAWYLENKRDLAWRDISDPYRIWLSEIILQQTRVSQGTPYYHKFLSKYPDIISLANAPDDEVMKLWQGLGYYSRARNLLEAARTIRDRYNGKFPGSYEEIRALKGVGDYTAAAIASFAFAKKYPVLDGNVFRFITRLYGVESEITRPETRKQVLSILQQMIDMASDPAVFNQALMEFGALHCTPKNPLCHTCVFQRECYALAQNKIHLIPNKAPAKASRKRYMNYFIFIVPGRKVFMQKRITKDIWEGLYEFPLVETTRNIADKKILENEVVQKFIAGRKARIILRSETILHKLSHQDLHVKFFILALDKTPGIKKSPIFDLKIEELENFAIPRVIDRFLQSTGYLKEIDYGVIK